MCGWVGGGWKMASEHQKLELQVVVGPLLSELGTTLRCSPRVVSAPSLQPLLGIVDHKGI